MSHHLSLEAQETQVCCVFIKIDPRTWLFHARCGRRVPQEGLKDFIRHHMIKTHRTINKGLPEDHPDKIEDAVFAALKQWMSTGEKTWSDPVSCWKYVYERIAEARGAREQSMSPDPYWTTKFLIDAWPKIIGDAINNPDDETEVKMLVVRIEDIRRHAGNQERRLRTTFQAVVRTLEMHFNTDISDLRTQTSAEVVELQAELNRKLHLVPDAGTYLHGLGLDYTKPEPLALDDIPLTSSMQESVLDAGFDPHTFTLQSGGSFMSSALDPRVTNNLVQSSVHEQGASTFDPFETSATGMKQSGLYENWKAVNQGDSLPMSCYSGLVQSMPGSGGTRSWYTGPESSSTGYTQCTPSLPHESSAYESSSTPQTHIGARATTPVSTGLDPYAMAINQQILLPQLEKDANFTARDADPNVVMDWD